MRCERGAAHPHGNPLAHGVAVRDHGAMRKWSPYEFTSECTWADDSRLAPSAVASALVVGDVHRGVGVLRRALDRAVGLGASVVVSVGDFWLSDRGWPDHGPDDATFMWTAHDAPMPIVVVDGNHEAWPALRRYKSTPAAQDAFTSRRPLHLGGSLWWAWRGSVWTWGDRRFGALGGAVSPDKQFGPARFCGVGAAGIGGGHYVVRMPRAAKLCGLVKPWAVLRRTRVEVVGSYLEGLAPWWSRAGVSCRRHVADGVGDAVLAPVTEVLGEVFSELVVVGFEPGDLVEGSLKPLSQRFG